MAMADPGWGIWGKFPPPPPPPPPSPSRGASHTSDKNTRLCVRPDQFSYKTRENNMHILLEFITKSPETKANQCQTRL